MPVRKYLLLVLALGLLLSATSRADELSVVADTPATHSLVSMIMQDEGSLELLIPSMATPHHHALRPSDANRLQSADIVIWTSRLLTPWLARSITSLSSNAQTLELMAAENTILLPLRNNKNFENHHGSSNDADAPNARANSADGHLPTQHDDWIDPHGWLDPDNAITWLGNIASLLATADPPNADYYRRNARSAQRELNSLKQQIAAQLNHQSSKPFVVYHDSYYYFESRFNLHATAAISLGDATQPGIRHVNTLRQRLENDYPHACVFSEPQFNRKLVDIITRDLNVYSGTLDPMGASFSPGPSLYPRILKSLTEEFLRCFNHQTG